MNGQIDKNTQSDSLSTSDLSTLWGSSCYIYQLRECLLTAQTTTMNGENTAHIVPRYSFKCPKQSILLEKKSN